MHTFRRFYNPLKILCCQQRYKEEVLDVKIKQGYTIESGCFRILPMFKDFFVVCTAHSTCLLHENRENRAYTRNAHVNIGIFMRNVF
jgi:hypothetical protein